MSKVRLLPYIVHSCAIIESIVCETIFSKKENGMKGKKCPLI